MSIQSSLEVLEAENQSLKLQIRTCECGGSSRGQSWTVVKSKKVRQPVITANKYLLLSTETKIPFTRESTIEPKQKKQNNTKFSKSFSPPQTCQYSRRQPHPPRRGTCEGDDQLRTLSATCASQAPGYSIVRTLDLHHLSREVLIAGTNDLAVGEQHKINRHVVSHPAAPPGPEP
ncbi:hypothetical protein J6590_073645 [Homalodisca vitripennis]|nr:hypothetical protein J6590_073645 [Homalodisca vitripennis]